MWFQDFRNHCNILPVLFYGFCLLIFMNFHIHINNYISKIPMPLAWLAVILYRPVLHSWVLWYINFQFSEIQSYRFLKLLYKFAFTQQRRTILFAPHSDQHEMSPVFLIFAILTGRRWNLSNILNSISLIPKEVEHSYKCF